MKKLSKFTQLLSISIILVVFSFIFATFSSLASKWGGIQIWFILASFISGIVSIVIFIMTLEENNRRK